jgi:hypothetical protein
MQRAGVCIDVQARSETEEHVWPHVYGPHVYGFVLDAPEPVVRLRRQHIAAIHLHLQSLSVHGMLRRTCSCNSCRRLIVQRLAGAERVPQAVY